MPSHAYMNMLYKYPQAEFPYARLLAENAARWLDQREFEIADTGVFDNGGYFDIAIEYAKARPDDILMRITATNHGPQPAPLHILPFAKAQLLLLTETRALHPNGQIAAYEWNFDCRS